MVSYSQSEVFLQVCNKSDRLLARMFSMRKRIVSIEKHRDSQGNLYVATKDIAKQFQQYYERLYNLPEIKSPEHVSSTRKHFRFLGSAYPELYLPSMTNP